MDEQSKQDFQDKMEGGFAVVDRERVIEEETREITPWYKHFIHAFTSPEKMMDECFNADPPKGASVGVVGCILFSLIYIFIYMNNPVYKQFMYEQLRVQGISETAMDSTFQISMISGSIGAVIGIFMACFMGALIIFILKAIVRDKGKFGAFFKVMMIATMVTYAVQCVDASIATLLGQSTIIFSLAPLMDVNLLDGSVMGVIASSISLETIVSVLLMSIGYKVVTHTSYTKGAIISIIYQVITIGFTVMITLATASITQSLLGA